MTAEHVPLTTQPNSPCSTAPGPLSTSTTPSRSSNTASSTTSSPFSFLNRSSDIEPGTSSGSEAGSTVAAGRRSSGGSEEGEFEYVSEGGSGSAWKDVSRGEGKAEKIQSDVSSVSPASPPPSPVALKTSTTSTSRASPPVYSKWAPPGYVPSTPSPASLAKPTVTPASTSSLWSKHAVPKPEVKAKQATLAKMRALLPQETPAAASSTSATQPAAPPHSYPPSPPSPRTSPKLAPTPLFERAVESTIQSNLRADNHEAARLRRQHDQDLALEREKLKELEGKLDERERLLQEMRDEAVVREKKQDEIVDSARRQVQVLEFTVSRLEAQVEQYKADVAAKQAEVDALEVKLNDAARELIYSDDYLDERKKEAAETQARLKETMFVLERARGRITELETLVELRDMDIEDAHKQTDIVDAKLKSTQEKLEATTERCQKAEKLAIKRQKELDKLLLERSRLEADLAAAQNSPRTEALLSPVERDESDRRIADLEARLETELAEKKKLFAEVETIRFRLQQLSEEHDALKATSSKRIAELEAEKKMVERRATQFAAQAVKAKEELKKRTAESGQTRRASDPRFVYTAEQLLILAESPTVPTLAPGSLPPEIDANKPKALYDDPQAPVTTYMQMRVRYISLRDRFADLDATLQRLKREKAALEKDNAALKQETDTLRGERDHAYDLVREAAELLDAHVDDSESSTPNEDG
ncbi:hypothetical protein RTBOTA2_004056 [Rhodotorula toruloides]|uniref:Uncharacterized protein n=2 Tax=Rhodotorula toruloides TaxID=5286 RepID=A0A2T0A044_RHOTO|nr:hypothetical protein RTBOTA2_004056 [Rhodotorula toruloides]PRQ71369.1 hypothetical protein AAT19DRAFT_10227 [Rhodotorula toruloides]